MTETTRERLLKWGVVMARIVIGALFVISGITKDIDLWGTVYKIEEYLNIWDMQQPRTIVFMAAIMLSGAEFTLGALLMLGCCRRAVPMLLTAIMAVMLPLTLYIYISNPVSDCGCFGDFLVISNGATFWKNVVITAVLIFLIKNNRKAAPLFTPYIQWLVITLLVAFLLSVGLYGYNIQPMIDFRSFPVGSALLHDDDTDGESSNEGDVTFLYEKNGDKKEFALDALPDSTWTFIDRVDHSQPTTSLTELVAYDLDGNDATSDAVGGEGEEILLIIPQLQRAEMSWTYFLNELSDYMVSHNGRMAALIAGDDASVEAWADISMASYPIYTAEATTLKELARGNMALVYLRDGNIVWKRSMALMDTSLTDAMLFSSVGPEIISDKGGALFRALSFALLLALMALYILDSTGRLVKWRLRHRRSKRNDSAEP